MPGKKAESNILDRYYNSSQLRADSWNKLKNYSYNLANKKLTKKDKTKQLELAKKTLNEIEPFELYWGFPGKDRFNRIFDIFESANYEALTKEISYIVRMLMSSDYRRLDNNDCSNSIDYGTNHKHNSHSTNRTFDNLGQTTKESNSKVDNPYFEVLIVDTKDSNEEANETEKFYSIQQKQDYFRYKPIFINSFEDAIVAVMFNYNIQSVVIRYDFPMYSENNIGLLKHNIITDLGFDLDTIPIGETGILLSKIIKHFRPELDIFLITDQSVEEMASKVSKTCNRIFYNTEDYLELHLNILRGIYSRYNTPFFTALKDYSKKPTGVFHALPISRGKSIFKSNWIKDMGEFYGINTFLAETSSTSGGLDSLLEPTGPIKEAQTLASRAFGSDKTFFATNGTSSCNKIVVQALIKPNDIVLVDRDCHKSHHYGLVLSGAEVVYLDSYPLQQYSIYGAVPLKEIKNKLLSLKKAGKLNRVKMLLLTNCTFDGVIYNVEKIMQECLAIKSDLIFLWDEAWFGFARFGPTYRTRTGMFVASKLKRLYKTEEYKDKYDKYLSKNKTIIEDNNIDSLLETELLPNPEKVRIRVYSTQSTHKTLTSLRQGSMIHINDQDYRSLVEESFREAYMTHTTTSPNYQIIASLDLGRRQAELEGFELVSKQVEMAIILRQKIMQNPLLTKYFKILAPIDMIPQGYKKSISNYYDFNYGWDEIWNAWSSDEFALDCSRITMHIGKLGIDGDTFKTDYLMNKYGIQVNKTSKNTVLFMTNIGTTRSSIAYLLEVLTQIAEEIDSDLEQASNVELKIHNQKVYNLTVDLPPLPDFSYFHTAFREDRSSDTTEGKIRDAFFLAYDNSNYEYIKIDDDKIDNLINSGVELVSASFVTPYPPGFPILVPGQVISIDIISFLRELDVKEIHGYRFELGLRVFTKEVIKNRLNNHK